MIHTAIVSASPAVRIGLQAILQEEPDITVLLESASLSELADSGIQVDVVVFDSLDLADWREYQASTQSGSNNNLHLLSPSPALLMIIHRRAFDLPQDNRLDFKTLKGHAWGILSDDASRAELAAAVRAVAQGLIVGTATLLNPYLDRIPQSDRIPPDVIRESLTEREKDVLQLLAQGMANKQIASRLDISPNTVKYHINAIYGKLGATNRTEAVRIALQHGLIVL